jgi:alpha-aminoadipic semialdehyde synthase
MESKAKNLCLGILREATTAWERRVPFTPSDVQKLISEKGIQVIIQPSSNRCFTDREYQMAGAMVSEDLTPCSVIAGIKPIKIEKVIPQKTYMMYTRLATGNVTLSGYLKGLLEKRVTLIDYERIRDEKDRGLVGSSKLAGFIGAFNSFRVLGEFLLLRENINTPFLHIGGSAYMHKDKEACIRSLRQAW